MDYRSVLSHKKKLEEQLEKALDDLLLHPIEQKHLNFQKKRAGEERFCLETYDKTSAYIYVFEVDSEDSALAIREACCNEKQNKEIALPQLNVEVVQSQYLYVGSSVSDINARINQHLGNYKGKTTYSLHLKKWLDHRCLDQVILNIYEVKLPDESEFSLAELIQMLEDSLWKRLQPVLGKKGGK